VGKSEVNGPRPLPRTESSIS